MEPEEFGQSLRRSRHGAGLTQPDLARHSGYSVGHIRKLEQGTRRPTRDVVAALANALQVPPEVRAHWERAASPIPGLSTLPPTATSFVGRESEIGALRELLLDKRVRLVTIVGPGGVGKTRLAVEATADLASDFPDGIFFVSLSPVEDPALLPAALIQTVGLDEPEGTDVLAVLKEQFVGRHSLVIFDTFEHVLSAALFVADLLAACPSIAVAVTSRTPLNLSAEREFPLSPLPLPQEPDVPDVLTLRAIPSVALFVQRAQTIDPAFVLSEENSTAVAEICRRLDGLPLAIELAAARTRMFSPRVLLSQLEARFDVLSGGRLDVTPRHRSLRAALDWSYQLLDPQEAQLFMRLAVFTGSWSLQSAERVCRIDLPVANVMDALLRVSLIQRRDDTGPDARYGMLDTVRAFALELLRVSQELFPLQREHARYFAGQAEDANAGLKGEDQELWLQRLEADYPNLVAALTWSLQYDLETAIRLATALCQYWYMRGQVQQGRRWIDLAQDQALMDGNHLDPALYGALLNSAGVLDFQTGAYGRARQLLAGAVTLRRTIGDKVELSASLTNLGNVLCLQGDFERGGELFEESLTLGRELDDSWDVAAALNNLGNVSKALGEDERAAERFEESLSLFRDLGDTWNAAIALNNLGNIADRHADWVKATQLLEESLASFRALNDPWGTAVVLCNLSYVALHVGDIQRGRVLASESLRSLREAGDTGQVPEAVEALGLAMGELGYAETMIRLLAASSMRREDMGIPGEQPRAEAVAQAITKARAVTGEPNFDAAWKQGRAMTVEELLDYALGLGEDPARAR